MDKQQEKKRPLRQSADEIMARRGFLRDAMGVLNSNLVSLFSGLLLVVVLTRALGTDGFGQYNALIVVPLIVVSLTHLGIRGASIYLLGSRKFDTHELVSSVVVMLLMASLAGILLSAGAFMLYRPEGLTPLLMMLILFIIPFRLTTVYVGGIFYGQDEIRKANQLNWMINSLNLILAIVLVWWMQGGLLAAIISILIANLYVALRALWLLKKQFHIRLQWNKRILKKLLQMGILFSLSFFVLQLNYKIDILLLDRLSTLEEVGLYALATQIVEQLWQVPLAVGLVLFTRTANAQQQSNPLQIVALTRLTLIIVAVLATLLWILGPWLIPPFFGQDFYDSGTMLRIILPGIWIMAMFRVLSGQLAGMGKPQVTLYLFIPALLINILLNWLWIPQWGGRGAAWASDISYAAGSLGYWIYFARLHQLRMTEILRFSRTDWQLLQPILQSFSQRWKK